MKKIIFLFACLAVITNGYSQQLNFHRTSIGLGAGLTVAFVDVQEHQFSPGIKVNLDHYFTPFMTATLEIQGGNIAGGDSVKNAHLRAFQNSYKAISLGGKVQLGQFVYYENSAILRKLKGLYGGIGFGAIQNNMTKIVRIKPDGTNYKFPGKDKSINFLLPLDLGINFELKDSYGETRYIIGLGYQSSLVFGEGLDGYNDPPEIFQNNALDSYNIGTIGLKYCFGTLHNFYRRR